MYKDTPLTISFASQVVDSMETGFARCTGYRLQCCISLSVFVPVYHVTVQDPKTLFARGLETILYHDFHVFVR